MSSISSSYRSITFSVFGFLISTRLFFSRSLFPVFFSRFFHQYLLSNSSAASIFFFFLVVPNVVFFSVFDLLLKYLNYLKYLKLLQYLKHLKYLKLIGDLAYSDNVLKMSRLTEFKTIVFLLYWR